MWKEHLILTCASNFEAACAHTTGFFEKTMLLQYDKVSILDDKSYNATSGAFWEELERGVAANRELLAGFIDELSQSGCATVAEVAALEQGYPSKVFHIIAHLLDGFVGIDSVFYSLPEDSHWLSGRLRQQIERNPERYWLMHVRAQFASAEAASVVHL